MGRMMFAARTSMGTISHVRATVVAAAETDALHQAASAASLLGRRKPDGIQSPWPPSALFRAARMVHPCEEFVVRSFQSHFGDALTPASCKKGCSAVRKPLLGGDEGWY